jgi:hypothetical protein
MAKGKKPQVVTVETVYHADGSSTETEKIVNLADRPKTRVVPVLFPRPPSTDELIARVQDGGRVHNRDLLREIGYARLNCIRQDGVLYALIKFELLEIIALKLAPSAASVDKATKGKRAKARSGRDKVTAEIARILRKHPDWKASRVARQIIKERGKDRGGVNFHTLRKLIPKIVGTTIRK